MPEEKKEKTEDKSETRRAGRPDNCAHCSKRLSKKQWYYRNGKFYCSKTCWKNATAKKAA